MDLFVVENRSGCYKSAQVTFSTNYTTEIFVHNFDYYVINSTNQEFYCNYYSETKIKSLLVQKLIWKGPGILYIDSIILSDFQMNNRTYTKSMLTDQFNVSGIEVNSILDNIPPVINSLEIVSQKLTYELGQVLFINIFNTYFISLNYFLD